MRVALCLSGQPRFVQQAFQNIYDNLIVPNDADVFFHCWYDQDLVGKDFVDYRENGWDNSSPKSKYQDGVKESLIDLYKPKAFLFENQIKSTDTLVPLDAILQSHARHYNREYFVNMIYASWLSIMKSNTVKEQFRLANGINYDYVIRARFDSQVNRQIVCEKFDPNYLYTDTRPSLPARMIEDWFAFGSNQIMNVYSSAFNFIEYAVEESNKFDKIFCGETLVYEMVRMAKLQHIPIQGLIHSPVRQNMV
jgi:hypothetical protein